MPQDTQETDWIEWQGGECPIKPGDHFEYVARDGFSCSKIAEPQDCTYAVWGSIPHFSDWDIIRFRIFQA